MTIDEMKQRKTEFGLTCEMIAKASGIPLSTLQKLFSGSTKAPRKATIDAVEKVFREEEKRRADYRRRGTGISPQAGASVVCEPGAAGSALMQDDGMYSWESTERRYTLDDYYALPEERRVELIDGKFYDMTAPTVRHQSILGDLHILFRECVAAHDMPCRVTFAPCDVRLDRDRYTMVQPDLIVSCHEEEDTEDRYYEGAPDLLVEVLSPSTRSKDMLLKLYKYHNAGVREYWIVDPSKQSVTVHYFEEEEYEPRKYDFDAEIPVNISQGKCSIDFSRVGRMPGAGWRRK